MKKHSTASVLQVGKERALAREWIRKLSIKAHSELADCGNLSGGNQQKVVLAKWRSAGADIMLLITRRAVSTSGRRRTSTK